MKATQILSALTTELKITYQKTSDFENWATVNSNVEVMIDGNAYCIDYSIKGNRQVTSELTVMTPKRIDGQKKWFKSEVNKDLKAFIESSINQLIPILYDELEDAEAEAKTEFELYAKEQKEIAKTEASLYISER